ncbi:acetyl-CoA carboxylase biotin carboxyl carrier protein [Actinophytocola sp.]|uniref:acetyl-CoA carboxylase biotin carboxyl carrier protein n=1 Tax=Actinophytocola sp. TaxID=1872138 RepID=UPI002ED169D4
MSYRPRAVHDDERVEAPADLDAALASVRRTAAELLASSPVPPATLNVRAGDVSVEMGWATGEAVATTTAAPTRLTVVPAPEPTGETINAATVGVFYRAPSPGAPPFVVEGDEVGRGQQVAIVEAMKLMLPVEADKAGRIAEVLVADGEAVEYGQPLFRLAAADQQKAA